MGKTSMNRRQLLGGIAAVGAASTLAAPRIGWSQTAPIRIGCLQTLSGAMAITGQSHIIGAEIAVDMINDAGGIDGRPLELVVRDTQVSAATAVATLREFSGSGVNLVMGEAFSSVNLAAAPLLVELGLAMASPSAVAMELTHEMYSPNFFRCGPNAFMQYNGQTRLLAQEFPDVRKWGGIQTDGAGFKSGWDTMAAQLRRHHKELHNAEVQINDPLLVKLGSNDYRSIISQLMGQGLEGLIFQMQGQDALNFIRQAEPFDFFRSIKAIAANNIGASSGTLSVAIPDFFTASCYWHPMGFQGLPMTDEFVTRYKAKTGFDEVDVFSTMAHTAIYGFAGAIRTAGSTDTAAVVAAMESAEFDSLHGPLAYRTEDHQLLLNGGYVELGRPASGTGFVTKRFVKIPYAEIIEPASPGTPFVL